MLYRCVKAFYSLQHNQILPGRQSYFRHTLYLQVRTPHLAPRPIVQQEQAMIRPRTLTCPLFLKVVLVCLPYTVTGNVDSKSIGRSFSPTSSAAAVSRRPAWVAPRMICARQSSRRSPPMPTWDASHATISVGYGGRGDGNGAAGNQASVCRVLFLTSSCSQEEPHLRTSTYSSSYDDLVFKIKVRYDTPRTLDKQECVIQERFGSQILGGASRVE